MMGRKSTSQPIGNQWTEFFLRPDLPLNFGVAWYVGSRGSDNLSKMVTVADSLIKRTFVPVAV